jgi:hypothetical protein
MVMIEIEEKKVEKMSECIEKALKYMGKAMQSIDELMSEHDMGERYMGERGNYGQGGSSSRGRSGGGSYGNPGGSYGSRMVYGNRWEDEDDDDEMEERRRRRR